MTLFSISNRWKDILESIYQSVPNGYRISQEDRDQIDPEGKGAVYGEILYDSMATVFKSMQLTEEDVFVDLGSGVGKVVFQAALTQPLFKVKGVELSKDRFNTSIQVFDQLSSLLENSELHSWKERFELIHGDILKQTYSDVTHAFMCATCFRDDVIAQSINHLLDSPKLKMIVSLVRPDEATEKKLKMVHREKIPTSWSAGSSVYFYTPA